ncbi:hypothetical protein CEE45_08815 [Candidatus Heimdallarchaeota archaeon B3_Heim]|nr:MAG: hypothetical protein CEE45_08815 [Candidatus Heimdallarchaeota archaeon B3_Heim]
MDVEYQKKEVTWCLDRVGPKICLKAVAINDKLQHLEITSEDFILEFENEEAREFLGILGKIISAKPASIPEPVVVSPHVKHVEKTKEEIVSIPETKVVKPKPILKLDTAEILEVLKQSESNVEEERISFVKKFAENEARDKKPTTPPISQQVAEEPVLGISAEENGRPSEIFKEKLNTASFFGEVEEKSPLEQLLEENEDPAKEVIPSDPLLSSTDSFTEPEETQPQSEPKVPFSPDDLNSTSFVSNFSTGSFEQEIKPEKLETEETESHAEHDHQEPEPDEQKAFLNEEERKKDIERERAARKKRLWELTRGF